MKKLKFKNVMFRVFVLALAVIFVSFVPKLSFDAGDDLKYIYGSFIGQKSSYNGMIEIWNVDSFESGLKPKFSYLEEMAKRFQKKYKGVYVMLRNLTIGECENLIKAGTKPDLISCSYGVVEKIKPYVCAFEKSSQDVLQNFADAGKGEDGKTYGIAWCTGFYFLISTNSKLEKAGVDVESAMLNKIAFDAGYEYKAGKKTKVSKSLVFGTADYLMPKNALKAYNKARSIQIQENENEELNLKSQYSAYTSFLSNDATILLGTHRDVFKMQAREENGKVSDVVCLPLADWTDLVQFSFLIKNDNKERSEMAEKFALFLTEIQNQKQLEKIGLFSVTGAKNESFKGVMCDITLENISDCELKKVIWKLY